MATLSQVEGPPPPRETQGGDNKNGSGQQLPSPPAAAVGAGSHTVGNTVYLVTGGTSGIGAALLPMLLARPRTTVLALHRPATPFPDPHTTPALSAVTHATSALIPQHYTAAMSAADVHWMASGWRDAHSITRIDVVIAGAGASPRMRTALNTPWADIVHATDVNLGGPLRLVQGLRALLGLEADVGHAFPPPLAEEREAAGHQGSVFAFISSSVGSTGSPEPAELAAFAYGASKAAANHLVSRLHVECAEQNLCAFAIHPGWVRTRMGLDAARDWGMPENYVPLTAEDSAKGVLSVVDAATRKKTGGKFMTWEGDEISW